MKKILTFTLKNFSSAGEDLVYFIWLLSPYASCQDTMVLEFLLKDDFRKSLPVTLGLGKEPEGWSSEPHPYIYPFIWNSLERMPEGESSWCLKTVTVLKIQHGLQSPSAGRVRDLKQGKRGGVGRKGGPCWKSPSLHCPPCLHPMEASIVPSPPPPSCLSSHQPPRSEPSALKWVETNCYSFQITFTYFKPHL